MSPADLISNPTGDQVKLLWNDLRWLALRAIWRDANIRRVGQVIVARSTVRRDRFPKLDNTNVIVAIRTERNGCRSLMTYATSDIDAVLSGRVAPLMTLQMPGVRLEFLDNLFTWPAAEAIWTEYHDVEMVDLVPAGTSPEITRSWYRFKFGNWELFNTGSELLSLILRTESTTGDMAIIEVVPQQISIYLGDMFFDPVPSKGFEIIAVPAEEQDVSVLHSYVNKKEIHQARAIMRWYRRTIYELILEEARAGRI